MKPSATRKNRRLSQGLARAIAKMGYCSRSAAQKLVEQGLVSLNGRVVTDPGAPFKAGQDVISFKGKPFDQPRKST